MPLAPPPPTPPLPPPRPAPPSGLVPAPAGRRIVGGLITATLHVILLGVPVVVFIIAIFQWDNADAAGAWFVASIILFVIGLGLSLLHDLVYVGRTSRTIGHRVVGCRLVHYESGEPIGYGVAAARWGLEVAGYFTQVQLFVLIINLVMVLTHPERRHLHDLATNTMLVSDRAQ